MPPTSGHSEGYREDDEHQAEETDQEDENSSV